MTARVRVECVNVTVTVTVNEFSCASFCLARNRCREKVPPCVNTHQHTRMGLGLALQALLCVHVVDYQWPTLLHISNLGWPHYLLLIGAVMIGIKVLHSQVLDKFGRNKIGGGVVVTGASTGIGRDCVEYLASIGFTVYAGMHNSCYATNFACNNCCQYQGVRSKTDFDEIKAFATQKKLKLKPIYLDVTSEESVTNAVNTVTEELGYARLLQSDCK